MDNLLIQHTDETPEINFNTNGKLLIKGVSIPENVANFYTPILTWLSELTNNLPNEIVLAFEIEYINTSSTRAFIDLTKKIMSLNSPTCKTRIIWRYEEEDEDNLDLGKDLEYSTKTTFEFETIEAS